MVHLRCKVTRQKTFENLCQDSKDAPTRWSPLVGDVPGAVPTAPSMVMSLRASNEMPCADASVAGSGNTLDSNAAEGCCATTTATGGWREIPKSQTKPLH